MLDDIATDQQIADTKRLQTFLYILMRDYLPSGDIHQIIKDIATTDPSTECVFCNPFLASDAHWCAQAIFARVSFKDVLAALSPKSQTEAPAIEFPDISNDPKDW